MSVLERILERKRDEVAKLRRDRPESRLVGEARAGPAPRGFARAVREGQRPRVIAEFKRASPSRGVISAAADPEEIALAYAGAGAAALSVLTDTDFFHGCLDDLVAARAACALPVLRKDFTIEPLQVLEARAAGADAVLLIAAALDDTRLRELLAATTEHGMDALVEVHSRAELDRSMKAGAELVGVNNRDLHTFETDVAVTRSLAPHAAGRTVVSESGLDSAAVLRELQSAGVHGFLIGEALMRSPDPGAALRELRGAP